VTAAVRSRRGEKADEPPRWPEREEELCEVFRLLADRGRMRIVLHLRMADELAVSELAVSELAAATGLSKTACSQQLRLLRGARLVHRRREGRNAFYSLFDEHVAELVDLVRRHLEQERG
jgi:ArsR family transcriptional regulator, lead/cadmium/zinc/bismuth-responsive transcriptional repressor